MAAPDEAAPAPGADEDLPASPSVAPVEKPPAPPAPPAPAASGPEPPRTKPAPSFPPKKVDLPHEEARRWGSGTKASDDLGVAEMEDDKDSGMEMFAQPLSAENSPVRDNGVSKAGRALTAAERSAKTRVMPTQLWAGWGRNAVPVLPLLSGVDLCDPTSCPGPVKLFLCVRHDAKGAFDYQHRVGDLGKALASKVMRNLREKCTSHVCKAHPWQGSMLFSALSTFKAMEWSAPSHMQLTAFLERASSLSVSLLLLPPAPKDVEAALTQELAWNGSTSEADRAANVSIDKQLDRRKAEFQSSMKPKFTTGTLDDPSDYRLKMLRNRSDMISALHSTACAWNKPALLNNTFGVQLRALLEGGARAQGPVDAPPVQVSKPVDPLDVEDEDAPLMSPPAATKAPTKTNLGGKRPAECNVRAPPKKKKMDATSESRRATSKFFDEAASESDVDDESEAREEAELSDAGSIINDECDSDGNPIESDDEEEATRHKRLRRSNESHRELHGRWAMSKEAERARQGRAAVKRKVRDSDSESGGEEDEDDDDDEDGDEGELSGEEGDEDDDDDDEEDSEDDASVEDVGDASSASDDDEVKQKRNKKKAVAPAAVPKPPKKKSKAPEPPPRPPLKVAPSEDVLPRQLGLVSKPLKLTSKAIATVTQQRPEQNNRGETSARATSKTTLSAAPSERSATSSSSQPFSYAQRQLAKQRQQQKAPLVVVPAQPAAPAPAQPAAPAPAPVPATSVVEPAPPAGQQRPHAFNRRKPIHQACMEAINTQRTWVEQALEHSPPSGPLVGAPMAVAPLINCLTKVQESMTTFANTGRIEHAEEALKACVQLIGMQRDVISIVAKSQAATPQNELSTAAQEISLAAGALVERVMPGLSSFTDALSQCAALGNSLSSRSQKVCADLVDAMNRAAAAHAAAAAAHRNGAASSSSASGR